MSANRDAGFTLLEMLVSLALLALLLAAFPSALQMGRRAWETSERLDRGGAIVNASAFVESRIARAVPLLRKSSDGTPHSAFQGQSDSVTFVGPAVDGPTGTGLFLFELATRAQDDNRTALVLRWAPYRPTIAADADAARPERILVADVATFRLRYFGRQKPDGERAWFDAWDSAADQPELVELLLAARDHGQQSAVPVTIELLARDVP